MENDRQLSAGNNSGGGCYSAMKQSAFNTKNRDGRWRMSFVMDRTTKHKFYCRSQSAPNTTSDQNGAKLPQSDSKDLTRSQSAPNTTSDQNGAKLSQSEHNLASLTQSQNSISTVDPSRTRSFSATL